MNIKFFDIIAVLLAIIALIIFIAEGSGTGYLLICLPFILGIVIILIFVFHDKRKTKYQNELLGREDKQTKPIKRVGYDYLRHESYVKNKPKREKQKIEMEELLEQHDLENLKLIEAKPAASSKSYKDKTQFEDKKQQEREKQKIKMVELLEQENKKQQEREKQKIEMEELLEQHDLENLKLIGVKPAASSKSYKDKTHKRYVPPSVRKAVWHRDNKKCVKCGSKRHLQFDHIIPVSEGGSATVANIELLCADCNRKKSNKIE